jgi:hypothetical protein
LPSGLKWISPRIPWSPRAGGSGDSRQELEGSGRFRYKQFPTIETPHGGCHSCPWGDFR